MTLVIVCSTTKWMHLLHLVSIREDLKFAAVVVTLEGDTVGERSNGSALIFPGEINWHDSSKKTNSSYARVPCRRGDTRNPVVRLDLFFIDDHPTELSSVFIPLQRVGSDSGDVHLPPEVPGKVTEVSSLFDNRTGTARSVLVVRECLNVLIGVRVTS